MRLRCKHDLLEVRTERDRCYWVECRRCNRHKGPKKHSRAIALVAYAVKLVDQHPRHRVEK